MEFDLEQARTILQRTPTVLRALLDGLPDAWTRNDEGPGTWSPHLVMAHLINGERTDWIPRTRIILAADPAGTFTPFDREGYFDEARALSLSALLEQFALLRAESLAALDAFQIGERELDLVAQHPGLGPVTLRHLLASWVVHDLGHLVQVSRTMARQYTDEVGPWAEYMAVLGRAT